MKILVTGGAGFIGSNLVRHLQNEGHQVTIFDNKLATQFDSGSSINVNFVFGDTRDKTHLEKIVTGVDGVFHLASAVGVMRIVNSPLDSILSTLYGGINILEICARHNKRVLITSTSEIYGQQPHGPIAENANRIIGQPNILRWSYAESKALIESVAHSLAISDNLNFVVVRLFNTVGPGQSGEFGMVIPRFVQAAIKNTPIVVFGSGKQLRTFCDVRDVVPALYKLFFEKTFYDTFNIGGTKELSILDLAILVKKLTKSESEIVTVPYKQAYGNSYEDTLNRMPDISRIMDSIEWKPKISLEETLLDIIKFEKSQMHKNL